MKRQAYDLILRCRLNGTQWTARLFLRSPEDAKAALYRFARYTMAPHEKALSQDWFYLVHCEVSADQSKPCTR